MNNILSNNLKRLRQQKNLTQEQTAEILGVTSQTISRWECGTTLPDVMLLPQIAKLYCVTVDDLYKPECIAYKNYAQRLASVYESTRDPLDFIAADTEFKKLMRNDNATTEDIRNYGVILQFMMNYCKDKAIELFDNIIQKNEYNDSYTYVKTRYQQMSLYAQIGRAQENINVQHQNIKNNYENPQEHCFFIASYLYAGHFDDAYKYFKISIEKFPNEWELYVLGGDICKQLKRYDEAFELWDKADQISNNFLDHKYSMAICYEELGEYEKAYKVWCEIVEHLKKDGYDIEAATEEKRAQKCLKKISE